MIIIIETALLHFKCIGNCLRDSTAILHTCLLKLIKLNNYEIKIKYTNLVVLIPSKTGDVVELAKNSSLGMRFHKKFAVVVWHLKTITTVRFTLGVCSTLHTTAVLFEETLVHYWISSHEVNVLDKK